MPRHTSANLHRYYIASPLLYNSFFFQDPIVLN